jgi:hypothetical protein
MNLIRVLFLGLAVLLPAGWTAAMAADEAPADTTDTKETKKEKKTKKGKKADKEAAGDKKAE